MSVFEQRQIHEEEARRLFESNDFRLLKQLYPYQNWYWVTDPVMQRKGIDYYNEGRYGIDIKANHSRFTSRYGTPYFSISLYRHFPSGDGGTGHPPCYQDSEGRNWWNVLTDKACKEIIVLTRASPETVGLVRISRKQMENIINDFDVSKHTVCQSSTEWNLNQLNLIDHYANSLQYQVPFALDGVQGVLDDKYFTVLQYQWNTKYLEEKYGMKFITN